MGGIVKVDPKEYGLEATQAEDMKKGLIQVLKEREVLAKAYAETIKMEITEENIKIFKDLRVKIRDNRTKGIEPWHKAQKEFYLRGGQFVDAMKRVEIVENERMENNLKEMEDFFVNQEKERKQAIYDKRCAELEAYGYDAVGMPLDSMDDEMYALILSGAKEAMLAKQKAEKAEEDRIAAEAKIKELHEQRKDQLLSCWNFVEDKSKNFGEVSDADFKKYLKEVKVAQTKHEEEQEAVRSENIRLASQAEKARVEADRKLKQEQEEKNRLAKELEAKRKAESAKLAAEKAEEDRLKAEAEKMAKAPVKKQLGSWVNSFEMPTFSGDTENEVYKDIVKKFEGFLEWARKKVNEI